MELIEIVWDIFSDVVNDFFFQLNNGFLNLLVHRMPGRSQPIKYGRHRSLVRLIGTALPLKPCQRTYSQIFHSQNKYGSNLGRESESFEYPDEGSNDFDAWSRDLKNNASDVISSITFSTPKEGSIGRSRTNEISAEKFAALEEQVLQLQVDIAKILSAQLLQPTTDSGSTTPSEESNGFRSVPPEDKLEGDAASSTADEGVPPIPSLPPPPSPIPSLPPPPPPPLPPPTFSLPPRPPTESQSFTDQINLYSKNQTINASHKRHPTSSKPAGMEEVLKNIGNVKLRHVERSPGGTPLRRRPLSPPRDDPAALLAAALRRRFAHMRPDESSPERPILNSSNDRNFSELSPKSFEDMDQLSYSRSQDMVNLGR